MNNDIIWKDKNRVRKTFSKAEDDKLLEIVVASPKLDWVEISSKMGNRTPRQCRERWKNYVDPSLLKDQWSQEEDTRLIDKFTELGSHWSKLKLFFPGRSVNSLKNRYFFLSGKKTLQTTSSHSTEEDTTSIFLDFLKIYNLLAH